VARILEDLGEVGSARECWFVRQAREEDDWQKRTIKIRAAIYMAWRMLFRHILRTVKHEKFEVCAGRAKHDSQSVN
jgi:site-specific DNA-adenine methylase